MGAAFPNFGTKTCSRKTFSGTVSYRIELILYVDLWLLMQLGFITIIQICHNKQLSGFSSNVLHQSRHRGENRPKQRSDVSFFGISKECCWSIRFRLVKQVYNCKLLDQLNVTILEKRPDLAKKLINFHHDNAPAHRCTLS